MEAAWIDAVRSGERTLAEAQGIDPAFLAFAAQLGRSMFEQGRLAEAEQVYKGLFALHPREAAFASALGLVTRAQGRLAEACAWLDRALVLSPGDALGHCARGEVKLALADTAGARADLEQAAALGGEAEAARRARVLLSAM